MTLSQSDPQSNATAVRLLQTLGASSRLLRHGEIVADVAAAISQAVTEMGVDHEAAMVAVGAVLHDAGKILHSNELNEPGHDHERSGERLLLNEGLSPALARICRTHADWRGEDVTLEERLIALADNLWKGKRNEPLELLTIDQIAARLGRDRWDLFLSLDGLFEKIASDAALRLASAKV